MPHVHLRIEGRVQGVGFRWFVRARAEALGISGVVRNLPDGSVEADASGTADALRQMIEALHAGPRGARVDAVHASWRSASSHPQGFHIVG